VTQHRLNDRTVEIASPQLLCRRTTAFELWSILMTARQGRLANPCTRRRNPEYARRQSRAALRSFMLSGLRGHTLRKTPNLYHRGTDTNERQPIEIRYFTGESDAFECHDFIGIRGATQPPSPSRAGRNTHSSVFAKRRKIAKIAHCHLPYEY
jgi:hypothetical protein